MYYIRSAWNKLFGEKEELPKKDNFLSQKQKEQLQTYQPSQQEQIVKQNQVDESFLSQKQKEQLGIKE